jgi:hypothetical protein
MLDTYIASYILSDNLTDMSPESATHLRVEISEVFSYWSQTQDFVRRVQKTVGEELVSAGRSAESEVAEAIEIRSREHASFVEEERELTEAVGLLQRTLSTLETEMPQIGTSGLGVQAVRGVSELLRIIAQANKLSSFDVAHLAALFQSSRLAPTDWNGNIRDTLMQFQQKAEAHLDVARKVEAKNLEDYQMLAKPTSSEAYPTKWDIAALSTVAESVGQQFGSFFHDNICMQLKDKLMSLEHKNGRVKLSEFYKPALDGEWQFQESVGYLRQIGALDESEQQEAKVIVPNYLMSPSNCIATSGFYSVCCKNECEQLLSHLEQEVSGPDADVHKISTLVANLPSSSESSPRVLSGTLRSRLEEIAAHHGGMVPLHSRLFAQWMHHAYPYECPYPQVSGATSAVLPEDWLHSGATASQDEMLKCVQTPQNASVYEEEAAESIQWSAEEELLVVRSARVMQSPWDTQQKPKLSMVSMMLFTVLVAIAYGLVQATKVRSCLAQSVGSGHIISTRNEAGFHRL